MNRETVEGKLQLGEGLEKHLSGHTTATKVGIYGR
jgi:hypothetical protein